MKGISSQDYQPSITVGAASVPSFAKSNPTSISSSSSWLEEAPSQQKKAPGKGMQLGKPKK